MRPSLLVLGLAALAGSLGGAASVGCARTAEERQLDDMREEIERLQVDRDRANERALHPEPTAEGTSRVSPSSPAAPPVAPAPADVRSLGDPSDPGDEIPDTEDKTPRPSIRVIGSWRSGRYGMRGEDQVQETLPDDGTAQSAPAGGSPSAGRSSTLDPEAKRAYDAALALVNARQYDRALDALAAFLVRWPDHPYADNAMFWRGECYFAKGDCVRASEQLEGTVTRYPAGNKVPDALLKLGMCSQKLGNAAKAKTWFNRLTVQFPRSEAARRVPTVTVPTAAPLGPASEDPR